MSTEPKKGSIVDRVTAAPAPEAPKAEANALGTIILIRSKDGFHYQGPTAHAFELRTPGKLKPSAGHRFAESLEWHPAGVEVHFVDKEKGIDRLFVVPAEKCDCIDIVRR